MIVSSPGVPISNTNDTVVVDNNINNNNYSTTIVMHDAPSNDCKCDKCLDPERKF